MLTNRFQGLELSALGMGCMRLPVIDGDDARIDEAAAAAMIGYAMEQGVNYYDTAWGYHGGNSEIAVGKILRGYPRDRYYIASKFPGYDLSNMDKVEAIFEEQLKKTGMEYFDFYLFHNVCSTNIGQYLDPAFGIYDYLMKQKANGRIRHLGFSTHGDTKIIRRFLDAYGKDMEFCQIQLNWLDWDFQKARDAVALLNGYGLPIWVMEPLRGGRLAKLAEADEAVLKALRPEESIPGWALRFLQSVPGVTMVLTGASDFGQLQANIETFRERKPLSDAEMTALMKLAADMIGRVAVPCTACRYCTAHCPQELDIPMLLNLYNEHAFTGGGFIAPMALSAVAGDKQPSSCIGCRSCEAVCPQQIRISEALADFCARLK